MKKTKRLLLFAVALTILIASLLIAAGASSRKNYLFLNESGSIYDGDSKSYEFAVPNGTEMTIFFCGDNESGDDDETEYWYTHGYCKITIEDDAGNEVYSAEEYINYDDTTFNVSLNAGDYTLIIAENNEDELTYCFSLYYTEQFKTEKITLDDNELILEKGQSTFLEATVYPEDKAEPVTWSSSNTSVATVDKSGNVTAKALGKATITAKSGSKKATCKISVTEISVAVDKGKSIDLNAYVKFISGSKNGRWSSSKKSVATVSSAGVATGVSTGKCNIIFIAKDGTRYKVVLSVYSEKVQLLKNKSEYLDENESKKYSVNIPADGRLTLHFNGSGTYGSCLVTISDSKNRQVSKKSKRIRCKNTNLNFELKKGKYTVKITENDDDEFEYEMSAYYSTATPVKATKVTLDKTSVKLSKGKTVKLKATISPSYVTDECKWSTSNKAVATVDKSGTVTAKALGKTTITVKCSSKTVKCKVIVNKADVSVLTGKTVKLASYVKQISNYKKGKWSSSDYSVAAVNSSGTVTGRKSGSCSIVFKAADGAKYTFFLKVKAWVTARVTEIEDENIYNDCWIRIDNNTGKDITYMTLSIKQYDNRGYRLQSPYDYYYINETLHSKRYCNYSFWVNDDARSAKVKILKVWFSDGTTYTP